jgi:hypothetical protein
MQLKRLKLPLDAHRSDLLLVGDEFTEGGRYVQIEIPRDASAAWDWLEWDDTYDRLAREWRGQFERADEDRTPPPPTFFERRAAADPSIDHSSHSTACAGSCPECP